jgi:YHS domain-containing protein
MRGLLFFIALIVLYYVLKTLLRSALKGYHQEGSRKRIKGEEMVLDPECHTYVIKERAVTRRVAGSVHSFCSEACAQRYEERHRS